MDNMNEYEIQIHDLKMKLECANDMIEAYKRECDALYLAMVKWSRVAASGQTKIDEQQAYNTRKILTPVTEKPPVEKSPTDWLYPYKSWVVIPDSKEAKSDDETPFRAVEKEPNSEEKVKVIQEAIRALYHANFSK